MKKAQFKGYVGLGSISAKHRLSKEERALNRRINTMNGIKHYGLAYTEKQKMYIAGTVPEDKIRKTEITQLLNNTLALNNQEAFDIVSDRYDELFFKGYKPSITKEEALEILKRVDNI